MTGTPTWTLSGFGDEIDPDPAVQFAVLLALGARHVEVRGAWDTNVVELSGDQLDRLAALLRAREMAVSAIASPVGKVDVYDDPEPELVRLGKAIAAAHRLAFHVTPGHLPAIVLDAGGGLDSSYWAKLVPQLAKDTGSEVITYDRAGIGASDEVPGPWKVQDAVSDLAAGLRALGATHDVVLVSHSLAGEIATYFVRDNPGWVSGAVLVDASLPVF